MSCGVGCRHSSDLAMLWLWGRPVPIAPVQPLASICRECGPKKTKKKKKKKERKKEKEMNEVMNQPPFSMDRDKVYTGAIQARALVHLTY